jgi:ADP-ribosylglycohydrolase
MVIAVNHSGRSAAVACLTGAILGARMGEEALPEFYMDGLYIADVLRDLADDLAQGCPMVRGSLLFDGDWESKYLHGEY